MIKAVFVYQIFESIDGNYSVNHFLVKECQDEEYCQKGDVITVIGSNIPTYKNVTFSLHGDWVPYKKSGEMQLKLQSYEEMKPTTGAEVLNYMESGIIKGIGSKNAKVIYDAFGANSLDVIEKEPKKLMELKGFGKKSVDKIRKSYAEHVHAKSTLLFFSKYNINTKMGLKIYNRFGKNTERNVQENPYIISTVKGIGFEVADALARQLGFDMTSEKRIEAGIIWSLKLLEQEDGNTGTPIKRLERKLYQVLNLSPSQSDKVNEVSRKMIAEKKVYISNQLCFRPEMYDLESECASHIIRIAHGTPFATASDVEQVVKEIQRKENIVLDEIQEAAVHYAVKENFLVITGGPGSGKTTTIKCVVEVLKELFPKKKFKLMAPTGRAARRMAESTGMYASTIHSGLRLSLDTEDNDTAEDVVEDVIIVDEVSMLDIRIATLLFRAIGTGKKVLLIGDVDQLPSVGPGAVLRDIILSNTISVVKLEKIFRQDKDSRIYINSRKIKNESTDLLEGSDFTFLEVDGFENAAKWMLSMYQEKIQQWGMDNVALLTPYRKYVAGCEYMNKAIQEEVNPNFGQEELTFHGTTFRKGDKVMNLTNDFKEGVDIANGDIGTITYVNPVEKKVAVEFFGDSIVIYEEEELEELELAYSYTIHKSQGGEYDCVITTLCDQHIDKMKTKNLLYTAVTRGKKEVVVIGNREAVCFAIKHNIDCERNTMLSEKMKRHNKKHNMVH